MSAQVCCHYIVVSESGSDLHEGFLPGSAAMVARPQYVIQIDVLQIIVHLIQQLVTLGACTWVLTDHQCNNSLHAAYEHERLPCVYSVHTMQSNGMQNGRHG